MSTLQKITHTNKTSMSRNLPVVSYFWFTLALACITLSVSVYSSSNLIAMNTIEDNAAVQAFMPETAVEDTTVKEEHSWPGVSKEELGHALVHKGKTFVEDARQLLLSNLDDFLEVYSNRPDPINLCGIRINHAYALYITIKALQPTAIIESGVNAGVSTYIMRAAAPDAKIFPIDPLAKPICNQEQRWIDTKNSVYYTGAEFKDVGDIDWKHHVENGGMDPDRTLVFLDDHLAVFDRLPVLMKHGFRHIILEDNYKKGKGATPGDRGGWTPKQMLHRTDKDSTYLWNNMIKYAEFPPLVPSIMSKEYTKPKKEAGGFMHRTDTNVDIVAPILRPDISEKDNETYEKICKKLGVDPSLKDSNSYMQLMNYNQISYFELVPMAPRLRGANWSVST